MQMLVQANREWLPSIGFDARCSPERVFQERVARVATRASGANGPPRRHATHCAALRHEVAHRGDAIH